MKYIDCHVHIDFYNNPIQVAQKYEAKKIYTIFVTNLPELFEKHFLEFSEFKYIRLALGYHPQLANEFQFNKEKFDYLIPKTKYIGEVGLDFSKVNNISIEKQIEVFYFVTKPKYNKGRIYSIHSKNAEDEVHRILLENNVKHCILHWYSGKLSTLKKFVELGCFFSVNYQMLTSQNGQKIIDCIPESQLLFETDGPFIKIKKKIVYPDHIQEIYNMFEQRINKFQNLTFMNFKRLLIERDIEDIKEK